MMPKSGNRLSEKIMLKTKKINDESDPTQFETSLKQTLGHPR